MFFLEFLGPSRGEGASGGGLGCLKAVKLQHQESILSAARTEKTQKGLRGFARDVKPYKSSYSTSLKDFSFKRYAQNTSPLFFAKLVILRMFSNSLHGLDP